MKQLLTKEYFKWLLYRTITNGLIIVSVSFFILETKQNIPLGILLFALSIITYTLGYKIKPVPLLGTCLETSNILLRLYSAITIQAGLGFVLLGILHGLDGFNFPLITTLGIFTAISLSGIGIYFYQCKKNGIIQCNGEINE